LWEIFNFFARLLRFANMEYAGNENLLAVFDETIKGIKTEVVTNQNDKTMGYMRHFENNAGDGFSVDVQMGDDVKEELIVYNAPIQQKVEIKPYARIRAKGKDGKNSRDYWLIKGSGFGNNGRVQVLQADIVGDEGDPRFLYGAFSMIYDTKNMMAGSDVPGLPAYDKAKSKTDFDQFVKILEAIKKGK
jgi:hypothetical protein